jgi:RNA polymerase sigma factor (sigma-70 family)
LDPESGAELLRRARQGDEEALNDLLKLVRDWMKRVASKVTPPRGDFDSSDVVQDAQLLIARKIERFRGEGLGKFCRWVYAILRNRATTLSRRGKPTAPLPEGSSADVRLPADDETPSGELVAEETRQEVRDAVSRLLPEDQDVILLHDFQYEALTHEEVAKLLGISTVAARKRYQRALERLQMELGVQP